MVKIYIEGKNKKVPESEFLRAILEHVGVPLKSMSLFIPTAIPVCWMRQME